MYIYIIILTIIIISTIVITTTMFKKQSSSLEDVFKELFVMKNALLTLKCQDSTSSSLITAITDEFKVGYDLVNAQDSSVSPTSLKSFNDIVDSCKQSIQRVLALPQCSCPQGTIVNGTCNCSDSVYNVPVGLDGITYCYDRPCQKHSTFLPSGSSDSSKNSCNCDSGYSVDSTAPGKICYNDENSSKLNGIVKNLSDSNTLLSKYL